VTEKATWVGRKKEKGRSTDSKEGTTRSNEGKKNFLSILGGELKN